jgi:hypothetical protein
VERSGVGWWPESSGDPQLRGAYWGHIGMHCTEAVDYTQALAAASGFAQGALCRQVAFNAFVQRCHLIQLLAA